jgi:hypothetical protein
VLGAGPGTVVGTFDVPLGHLSLDDPGCRPQSAGGVEPAGESAQRGAPDVVGGLDVVRGESAPEGRQTGGRCAGLRRS